MRVKLFILISYSLSALLLSAQPCPDRESLWKRLVFLRDSSTVSTTVKLTEMLGYEVAITKCPYQNDSTHALLLQRIGAMYFYDADFINASRYMQKAIDIIVANTAKPSVNPWHNIKNYYNLAWIYDSLNNVTGRMKALDSCVALSLRLKSADIYCITALHARVEYFFSVGDYDRCINYATMCERISREYCNGRAKEEYLVGLQFALISLFWKVNALIKFNNYAMAEELLSDKIEECKKAGLTGQHLAYIYQVMAEMQLQKGNYQKALVNYKKAFSCALKAGDNMGCKVILNNIGYDLYLRRFNNPDKALDYCKKALTYINKESSDKLADNFETLNVLGYIANIYAWKGIYDSSSRYFQLALNQVRPGINEMYLLQIPGEEFVKQKKMHYLAKLIIDKGDAFKQQYITTKKKHCLDQAIQVYKVADQLLDRIKSQQVELQSKLFWRSDTRRLYEHAIEVCYLQGNTTDGFYFFEKSRAVLLNDQLNEQRWIGESEILKQTQLKRKISRLENELNNINEPAQSTAIKTEIFLSKQEMDRMDQTIKQNNPLYYQNFIDTGFITLPDVQQRLLKDRQSLLEIFLGDSAVFVLLVTATESYLTKVNKQDFETTSNKYISYLANANSMNRAFSDFINTSSHLYNLIFRERSLPPGRIIVSPDGRHFPFEALVTKSEPLIYFLTDHAVSYTYSARFLMNDFINTAVTASKDFIGIAPVRYPATMNLSPLQGSDQSLVNLRSYFKSADNLTISNASKNNFLNQYHRYRIIQLYTHSSDSSGEGEPVIYFADSALYLSELFGSNKPVSRLIVLSACETGMGKLYKGEGIFSFNRGFAALGIPAAVTNLWAVENTSTYLLTELFYKWIAEGLPADVALQKAKLEFLQTASREKSMPSFWAGPVLVGKADAILSRPYPLKWIVIFFCSGCILFFAARKWLISKKTA